VLFLILIIPTREDYNDNSLAELDLFGYNPQIDGYPQPDNKVKFSGEEIGKVIVDNKTLETIFIPKD
jgi:hypothetical protein